MNPSVSQEMEDLLHRNRALQRRIASIKRSEEHLAKDNRSLSALVKMLRDEKVPLQARIKALERRIVDLNQRLFRAQRPTPSPSGTTITTTTAQSETVGNGVVGFDGSTLFLSRNTKLLTTFFAAHGPIWSNWVDTYGHSSPLRLSSLHPSQIREITSAVAPFVKLSEPEQKLPQSLVRPAGVASTRHINPARMLLRGMLAHFIVEEVLGEVFWGVDALGGKGAVETEVQGSCVPGDGSGGRGYEVVDERKDKGRDKEGEDKKGEGEGERKGYGQGGKRGHGKNVDENENLKSGSGIKLRFDAHDLSRAPSAGLPATARSLCVLSPGGRDWPAILPLGAGLAGVAEVLPAKVTPVPPKVMAMQYNLPGKEQMGDLMVLLQRSKFFFFFFLSLFPWNNANPRQPKATPPLPPGVPLSCSNLPPQDLPPQPRNPPPPPLPLNMKTDKWSSMPESSMRAAWPSVFSAVRRAISSMKLMQPAFRDSKRVWLPNWMQPCGFPYKCGRRITRLSFIPSKT